jgi:DNA invertase Pin-like site-specific DNA recombinase
LRQTYHARDACTIRGGSVSRNDDLNKGPKISLDISDNCFYIYFNQHSSKRKEMATGKFISYLRVSTARQGSSGLGLEAQRAAVESYLNGGRWTLVQEVIEVESGKKNDRPAIAEALRLCRLHRATLIIAKLDRLARNVHFISSLMEAGVEFIACDFPQANRLTVHILAAVAEHEAGMISARTKAALAAAKARGRRLGGLRGKPERMKSMAEKGNRASAETRMVMAAKRSADLLPVIAALRDDGVTTLSGIAAKLNDRGISAPRGGAWSAVQVSRVLKVNEGRSRRRLPTDSPTHKQSQPL